ncbi:hypothetical protein [Chitinilyticum aquatile]|uniref:hypothetical protein n=1 Tax=Chitinilyticum aquatile TaxID=362520 RepID=UPI00042950B1|nr:hypothetical protein [Chitinilyticum aquatile]
MTRLQHIINHLQAQISAALPGVPIGFSEEAAFAGTQLRAIVTQPLDAEASKQAGATLKQTGVTQSFAITAIARGATAFAEVEAISAAITAALQAAPPETCGFDWLGDRFEFVQETAGLIVAKRSVYRCMYAVTKGQRI